MFCSTIIPTINRATLSRTVLSVLEQSFDSEDFEVIVVNDSGQPLPEMNWQQSKRVRVVNTNCHERSVARNTGAALSTGRFLHFLDDDDLMMPGALQAFWELSQKNDSGWLSGSYQTVDNEGVLVEELFPNLTGKIFAVLVSGESIPLQASLLRADVFFAVSGFDPDPEIIGVEDRDLGRRVAIKTTVAFTPCFVAKIRIGEIGSTTRWASIAESDRKGREKALRINNALFCLSSSMTSSYWHGRVCRAYLASVVWNLKRKNILIAFSRLIAGLSSCKLHFLRPGFWSGLRTKVK